VRHDSPYAEDLVLEAAARGFAITKIAVWEANVLVDDSRPPTAHACRHQHWLGGGTYSLGHLGSTLKQEAHAVLIRGQADAIDGGSAQALDLEPVIYVERQWRRVAETVRWLVGSGRVPRRRAPRIEAT